MDALLLKEYNNLEMVQMPVPEIAPDDVLVRVRACGICGSDVHGLDGSTGRRIGHGDFNRFVSGGVAAPACLIVLVARNERQGCNDASHKFAELHRFNCSG